MKKTGIYCFCLTFLLSLSVFGATEDPIALLLKKLEEYVKKLPIEKVHLHLDKPYYAIGDDIWFKAYVVDGHTANLASTSSVLYVDLLDEQNRISQHLILPLQSGLASGDFKLADSLVAGNYRIRAYTNFMRNAGAKFFFDKSIIIGESKKTIDVKANFVTGENGAKKAEISFSNGDGIVYVDKKIDYVILSEGKNIAKGKGTSNQRGTFEISMPNLKREAKILVTIHVSDHEKITKAITFQETIPKMDLQFFPEGGKLVEGIPSKIAFKAINGDGLGQQVKGSIITANGQKILDFESSHLGMGSFLLQPESGKTYIAKIKLNGDSAQLFNLPAAEAQGVVLAVDNTDSINVNIKVNMSDALVGKQNFVVVAHCNGKVFSYATVPASHKASLVQFQKSDFPSGIITLTLFDSQQVARVERLVFINHKRDKLAPNLLNLKQKYAKNELVDISFHPVLMNKNWADLSVSVSNTSVVAPDLENETHILSSILLSSDLSGYIERPNYYFLNQNDKTKANLDLLLLTQGWRKINWEDIRDAKTPSPIFAPEKALKISGIATLNGKPVANSKLLLMAKSDGFSVVDTLSDAQGRFEFNGLDFSDSTKFAIQARVKNVKKDVLVKLDESPVAEVATSKNRGDLLIDRKDALDSYLKYSEAYLKTRATGKRPIELQEVNIRAQERKQVKRSDNLNGPGNADYVVDVTTLYTANSVSQFLQGRIAGIKIVNGFGISNRKTPQQRENRSAPRSEKDPDTTMHVILDGLDMGRDFTLDNLNPADIESIEVLVSMGKLAIYGTRGANGLFIVTSKNGTSSNQASNAGPALGITAVMPKGYARRRDFYHPKYEATQTQSQDLRTLVYWNPHLITDENGMAKMKFYNPNKPGIYRIVVEGVDSFGSLAHQTYTYQVE